MNFDRVEQALTRARFHCHRFATGQDAAQWLAAECSGKTVGIGGSMTAKAMKLEELLPRTSTVYWHWLTPGPETLANAATAQVYLTSVNALAETGELINIDGTGNRISAPPAPMSASTISWAATSWPRPLTRPSGGRGTSPRLSTPAA